MLNLLKKTIIKENIPGFFEPEPVRPVKTVPLVAPKNVYIINDDVKAEPREAKNRIYNLPVGNILPNPNQPRKDFDEKSLYRLAQSIKDYGLIQPVSVRVKTITRPIGSQSPVYELIAGERRLRAVKLLLWETIPGVIITANETVYAEIAIIENLQRENLNFFEQARAVEKLIALFGYTQEEAAKRLSVSQSYIANKLRLLKLSEEEKNIITKYGLTERHARSFIRISDVEERKNIIATIIKRSMNVGATEKYISKILEEKNGQYTMEELSDAEKYPKQRSSIIIKDVRLFLNTIDKVVDTIAQSGIDIKSARTDKGEYIEIFLSVPKKKGRSADSKCFT